MFKRFRRNKKTYSLVRNGRESKITFATKEDAQNYAEYLNQHYKFPENKGYVVK